MLSFTSSDHFSIFSGFYRFVCGRVVHSLLQLSERWPGHIWLVGRMKFASFEANLGGFGALESSILFFLSLSLGSPYMTEILLTGTLSLNSINQFIGLWLLWLYLCSTVKPALRGPSKIDKTKDLNDKW